MSTGEPTGQPADTTGPAGTAGPAAPTEQSAAAQAETVQVSAPPPPDLRAAAGLGQRPARGNRATSARRGRTVLIATAVLLLAAAAASLAYLGQQNRRRYYLVCGAEAITAAQGRGFPPWGQSALTGDAWRPVPVAPPMPCTSQTLDSRAALARQLGDMLVARVDAWVIGRRDGTGREPHAPEELAAMQAQLAQARLLRGEAGEQGDPAGADGAARAIERLQGDVDYWSARARVDAAMAALDEAAAQLDQAVAREPRHNGENAAAWQRRLARIRQELASGPWGVAQPGAASGPAAGDPSAPGSGAGAGTTSDAASDTAIDAAIETSGPAQHGGPPGVDAGVATPDPAADPALPPGTAAPPPAPRRAPTASVPRGGQLI